MTSIYVEVWEVSVQTKYNENVMQKNEGYRMQTKTCDNKKHILHIIVYNNWLSGNVFFVIDNLGTWDKQFCVKGPLNQSNVCQSIDSFDKIFKHVCLHWN